MGIIETAGCIGLGTFLGIVIVGIMMIYNSSGHRFKRASKKYKEENKKLNHKILNNE